MRITLLAFGILRDHLGTAGGSFELHSGSTVADLIDLLSVAFAKNTVPWSSIAVAVNQEYVSATHPLTDGDEVALLPPVSGGSAKKSSPKKSAPPNAPAPDPLDLAAIPLITVQRKRVRLTEDPIDPTAIAASLKRGEDGALVLFDGIVRDNTRGRPTLYLFYEAYPDMALAQMKLLAAQALADFPIRDLAIVHRLGRLDIGETSVAIAVASAHRAAAFDACRFLIDTLKKTVPIWKKEFFQEGAVWAHGDPFPPELTPNATKPDVTRTPKPAASSRPTKSVAKKTTAPAQKKNPRNRERAR
jgi:molybdopterin synthase catalytic subunit